MVFPSLRQVVKATLFVVAIGLTGIAFLATFLIVFSEYPLRWEFTPAGFEQGLKLFSFPIQAITAAIALATLRVAVDAIEAAMFQYRASTWTLLHTNFLSYISANKEIPVTAFVVDSQPRGFPLPGDVVPAKTDYLSPITTLRRMYLSPSQTETCEDQVKPSLLARIDAVTDKYESLCILLKEGDVKWLAALVELSGNVRWLRHYLMLESKTSKEWKHRIVLETSSHFGENRLPPFPMISKTIEINRHIFIELLCIVHALFFVESLVDHCARLYWIGVGVNSIWANADHDVRETLEGDDFAKLWINPHPLEGSSITIETLGSLVPPADAGVSAMKKRKRQPPLGSTKAGP
ncbi:hypothetical protein [Paraburkholderia domus]|uniref:hypothetical protein n=1 Tax=Paraburkholderia domus TaxID=2793075 RepID=UPI0019124BC2|nr:hypothetical protein [Paraburkholderia domus]MBK5064756.1 hypothetical protein [Burkholderia sp. R-70199]CAE6955904.1 hypothetical protein R70199_06946 [Paraburkholderia domus]